MRVRVTVYSDQVYVVEEGEGVSVSEGGYEEEDEDEDEEGEEEEELSSGDEDLRQLVETLQHFVEETSEC